MINIYTSGVPDIVLKIVKSKEYDGIANYWFPEKC